MKKANKEVEWVRKWFEEAVTCDGEPYIIDSEQAAAVIDDSLNTIVVARAGSGKTRTLVAKVVYLIARCGMKPDEIMVFVFNANAASEINDRLSRMRVYGRAVVSDDSSIASTFHSFARRIVYEICDGRKRCGKILAEEKGAFVRIIVAEMMTEKRWRELILRFVKGAEAASRKDVLLGEAELEGFAQMMAMFINRAQQQYLGGEVSLGQAAKDYLMGISDGSDSEVEESREGLFVQIGAECYRRYHWYLLSGAAKAELARRTKKDWVIEYGTDFNLIVSWASKLISGGRGEVRELLGQKKFILIDEYQDFSQLFLAAVRAIRKIAVDARLFVVGDDWQAINRFAGSDVEYFRNFEGYFGEGFRRYEITTNYRCDYGVVEVARKFMRRSMGEKGNFRAFSRRAGKVVIVNPKMTEVGYALVPYDLRVSVEDRLLREATERMGTTVVKKSMVQYLKTVIGIIEKNLEARELMILHRNNETSIGGASLTGFGEGLRWGLDRLGVLSEDTFDSKVKLMTMHKSKGLEADVVIIIEADEGVIPKMHPDALLYGLFGESEKVTLDDQKRLFYVAMTRAKKRLYILSEGGGFMGYLGGNVEK